MASNKSLIQKGFDILHPYLAGYLCQELNTEYGGNYWWSAVRQKLDDQLEDLPTSGTYAELMDSLDIANCLRILDRFWNEIFKKKLAIDYRTWSKELMGVRHKIAHAGSADFDENYTWRALDTMALLCAAFDDESAEEIREIQRVLRYGSSNGSTSATTTEQTAGTSKATGILEKTKGGLPSWRQIMEPHPDVAQGRYQHAEFAADLAQVARGEGAIEYRDPVEFFARTYVTDGMAGLLVQALLRTSGKGGEPVIQLKTAFGGGKTHSMLALYHMFRAKVPVDKVPNIKPVLEQVGLRTFIKANVAVLVGTSLDPSKARRPNNLPGIMINTIWGEMAAQLAESAGDLKLYDFIKEADKKGVSPGSEALKKLFDACGPCLILMDELVAYGKKLYGRNDLPAGTFDNFVTFIQEITEAARASENSIVVASIPQSEIEVGGDAGKYVLDSIEHTFGRMESIWKPVAANEGFEVVRRRLFLPCKDEAERDRICTVFSQFYNENKADFPIEASEVTYRDRMISCYPIHPEIFDRLYNDWSTLERFQRTRGVLRLMAAVIHELWMGGDASPMIMASSLPLDVPNVSYELTRHLNSDNWTTIIDNEVDGKNSIPFQLEKKNMRYGNGLIARRVARTIFLGSAPTSRSQSTKGLETPRIRLGAIQPAENIAEFNDALTALHSSLAYLYSNPSAERFWYDTRPTLRKTVEERATQIPTSDVDYEIENRLRKWKKTEPFSGIHICPSTSLDILDEQTVRLVVLSPEYTFKTNNGCKALDAAEDILNNRGSSPRTYRNTLMFIAPDQSLLSGLRDGVKTYLAWKSVKEDSIDLNLDASQNRETDNNLQRSNQTVDARMREAYCWLLVPYIDRDVDLRTVIWDSFRISGGTEDVIKKAAVQVIQREAVIDKWAPALLQLELDNLLWKNQNYISIKKLWDYLCTYCYLPRIKKYEVLEDAILRGVNSSEFFAYAADVSGERFVDLKYNQQLHYIDKSGYLVKTDAARKQIFDEQAQEERERIAVPPATDQLTPSITPIVVDQTSGDDTASKQGGAVITPNPAPVNLQHEFFMSAPIDNTRIIRDVQKYVEEVISHLMDVNGCNVEITLEVKAASASGFTQPTIRAVSENCRTLKIDNFSFDS